MLETLKKHLSAQALQELAASARQVLEIHTAPAKDLPLTASRIGGIGYWPHNRPYPENARGKPLALLAQFNFAELPPHPDLPASGILAFYIDPFDDSYGLNYDDPTEPSGYRSVYFADPAVPSLARETQRALFPPEAFAQEHDKDDADTQDADAQYDDDEDDNDFQRRWREEGATLIAAWLARRDDAVAKIGDAELSRCFQTERAALPPLAELAAQVDEYCKEIEKQPPSGSETFAFVLDDDYFPDSGERVAALSDEDILRWDLANQELAEADLAQSMHVHQVLTRQLITSGDTRWWQYWQHDPRAVIECDWQMQQEYIDAYNDAALSALWKQTESDLRTRLDEIVAEAQQQRVMSAPELDQLLEYHAHDAMQRLRAAFAALPPARQAHIRTLEMAMLQSRMDRLAERFAAQGFVAQGEAPHDAHEAIQNFTALADAELTQNSGNPLAGFGKLMGGIGQHLFDFAPESAEESAEVSALLADYIAENDSFIAEQNDAELSRLWQDERNGLQEAPPQSKSALAAHLSIGSFANRRLLREGTVNPVAARLTAKLHGVEYSPNLFAEAREWSHPVDGEYAVSARWATHYLLADSVEYRAHFGISDEEWREQHGLNGDESMNLIARARHQDRIARIYAQQHESHLFGYPRFAQEDPRFEVRSGDVLLFQLDSDNDNFHIQWGDCGSGQFFISPEDLAARRFDKAWFNWDCF